MAALHGKTVATPRGPKGEKRLADVIGNTVHVVRIATSEVEEAVVEKNPHAVALGKLGGKRGGEARTNQLARWNARRLRGRRQPRDGRLRTGDPP
jgi:hypothetical protein